MRRPRGAWPDRARRGRRRPRPALTGSPAAPCHAFGIAIDLLDGIAVPGLAPGHDAARLPATTVATAPPGHVDRAWPLERARTTRELRVAGVLRFSVAHAPGAGYLLAMPGYGRFLVAEDGASVLCEARGDDERAVALTVQALPLAATLRGLEPFHASGVVLDGRALMIAGEVGAGKSSLAAALVAGGADLLSDDVVAVDAPGGAIRAHPGDRRLHLRGPEAERLEAGRAPRVRPAGRRADRPRYDAPVADGPRPLHAVYLLARSRTATAPIGPMEPTGVALLGATYNLSVRDPLRLRRQLELSHEIAHRIGLYRVTVTPQWDAPRLAVAIRDHFEAHAG